MVVGWFGGVWVWFVGLVLWGGLVVGGDVGGGVGSLEGRELDTFVGLGDALRVQGRVQGVWEGCARATVSLDGGGSGVLVSGDGLVLTAAHVALEGGRLVGVVLFDGRRLRGVSLGLNRFSDAGLVRVLDVGEGGLPFVEMGSVGDGLVVGEWCFALGHSGGFVLERGAVLRVGRVIGVNGLVLRSDCALIGGDSGGGLFNLRGEVVGVHSRVSEGIEDNFHTPVGAFRRHWGLLLEGEVIDGEGGSGGGFLGVRTEFGLEGVVVVGVVEGSAADGGGLLVGDVVREVGGVVVFHRGELGWAVRRHRPGSVVGVVVERGGEVVELSVRLGGRGLD